MTISEKVKLVFRINKTENISNFCVLFPSVFRDVSFMNSGSKSAGNSKFPTLCSFSLIAVGSGPHWS